MYHSRSLRSLVGNGPSSIEVINLVELVDSYLDIGGLILGTLQ